MDERQYLASRIANPFLREAFLRVDRRDFLPEEVRHLAYEAVDEPLPIWEGATTTSLSLGLFMLDSLELSPGLRVLEVGTGSGYYTALLAEVVGEVVSVEISEGLYRVAKERLSKYQNVKLVLGDGSLGYEDGRPYDRVIVWAASPTLPCRPFEQLKEGGIMVVPIGGERGQRLYKVRKMEGRPVMTELGEVVFVKMRGVYGFYD